MQLSYIAMILPFTTMAHKPLDGKKVSHVLNRHLVILKGLSLLGSQYKILLVQDIPSTMMENWSWADRQRIQQMIGTPSVLKIIPVVGS